MPVWNNNSSTTVGARGACPVPRAVLAGLVCVTSDLPQRCVRAVLKSVLVVRRAYSAGGLCAAPRPLHAVLAPACVYASALYSSADTLCAWVQHLIEKLAQVTPYT